MNPEMLRLIAEEKTGVHVHAAAVFELHPDFTFITENGVLAGRRAAATRPLPSSTPERADVFLDTAVKETKVTLILALTDWDIRILEWNENGIGEEYVSFPRKSIRITVVKHDDERTVHILNTVTGETFKLDGTPSDLLQENSIEKVILGLLR